MRTCDSCAWWRPKSFGHVEIRPDDEGECRAHAPSPNTVRTCRADWPRTRREDGCGEHEPRRDAPARDTRPPPPPPTPPQVFRP